MRRLREQTRSLHERAERAMDLPSRLGSLDSYAALLARMYGFYAPLEERLATVAGYGDANIDYPRRRKVPLLRRDLAALGLDETASGVAACAALPRVTSLADALGCLYVLEGATLGGQLIGRQVQRQLGLGCEHGCAFFAGYGAQETGPMWKAFSEAVDAYGRSQPAAQGAMVAAACDTFLRFEHWIAV